MQRNVDKARERGGLAWASSRHGGRVPRDPGWNAGRSYRGIVSQGPHSIRSAALLVETVTNAAQNVGVEPAVFIKEGSRSRSLRGTKWVRDIVVVIFGNCGHGPSYMQKAFETLADTMLHRGQETLDHLLGNDSPNMGISTDIQQFASSVGRIV